MAVAGCLNPSLNKSKPEHLTIMAKKKKKVKKHQEKARETAQQRKSRRTLDPSTRSARIRWGIVLLISAAILFISFFWLPGEMHYQFKETYSFSALEPGTIYLNILLPGTGPYQVIHEPDIEWPGTWALNPEGQINLLSMQADIQEGETIEAVIHYRVDTFQGPAYWQAGPDDTGALSATDTIQAENQHIQDQAQELYVAGDFRATSRNIFKFTQRHLTPPADDQVTGDHSALTAYQTGLGGVVEHANLMVALSRAAGVPAISVSGLLLPPSLPFISNATIWDHPGEHHTWVEIEIDQGWLMADPSLRQPFFKRQLFGWSEGRHIVYAEAAHEEQVIHQLVAEAEEQAVWTAASAAPLRFVAWSQVSIENLHLIPTVSIRKTWDTRYLLMLSVILIMGMMNWLIGETQQDFHRRRNRNQ